MWYALLLAALAAARVSASGAGEIVLYDAAVTPAAAVASHSGGRFQLRGGGLEIETRGGGGFPGVLIRGTWDLSDCHRLTLELVHRDPKGQLPLTVRLDNPDANPGASRGVFVDRVTITKGTRGYDVALPALPPGAREITRRLTGMRAGPFTGTGVVADLDPARVVAVAVYVKEPKLDWQWGVKRIVAHRGAPAAAPSWWTLPAERFFPFIDVYGQFKYKDWPGKVHADADLVAAAVRERADLAAHPGPSGWSRFGGWADGPRRAATGHFRVEQIDGRWWLIDPEGHLYWSHGPVRVTPSTAITPLDGRDSYFEGLPPRTGSPFSPFYTTRDELLHPYYVKRGIERTYDFSAANLYRKYGARWFETFADLAHLRLRSWGLNTIANSSDRRICRLRRTPYTDRFELKSQPLAGSRDGWWPFRDPFDPSFRADVQRQMRAHREEMEDPWCFGFFVDNELSWGGPADLGAWTLASPPDQAAKHEFRRWLQAKYGNVARLNATWGTAYADWETFLAATARPGPRADDDLAAFTLVIADAYFRGIRDEFKAAAPHKLYLGCRFAGRGPEFAVRIAARYSDVLSYNIYARHLDDFRLPAGLDRPVLIGEFHFGALDRGLFHPGLVKLASQEERGRTYVQYVTSALRHPQVVGVHWHQFGDQATTGRFDGENFQVGFVDVCDTPYPETIAGLREVGYRLYAIRSGR
jgi:hypothetical protein